MNGFRRHSAPSTVRTAVLSVADACVPDPDPLLYKMLAGAIVDVETILGRTGSEADVGPEAWKQVCELTTRA